LELAARYTEEHGLELDTELTFHDPGVSAFRGTNADTGRLGAFRRAIEDGVVVPGSFLLVESLDRISRNSPLLAVNILQEIIQRGVSVVTLNDGKVFEKDTLLKEPLALLGSIITFMRAHEESAMKSVRLKAVYTTKRQRARDEGKPFTRRLPAWIRWNEETGKLELISKRAEVVQEIFELAEAGFGKDAIARRLNDRNEETFGTSKHWHRSYVGKILTNPACVGTFVPKVREVVDGKLVRNAEEPIHNYFPPVVNLERFKTQEVLSKVPRNTGRVPNSIFSGVGRCGLCGANFIKINKGQYRYLVCSTAHAHGRCEYLSVPYSEAESNFSANIKTIVGQAPLGENTKELEDKIINIEGVLLELASELSDLARDYRARKSPTIRDLIEKVETEYRTLKEELAEARKQREELSSGLMNKRVERLEKAFSKKPIDVAEANTAIRQVIKTIEFDLKKGSLHIQWHNGEFARAQLLPLITKHFAAFSDDVG
jgi:DNA invertase Pin-like site-specific DNA recombinase